jgi:hypothetical protein
MAQSNTFCFIMDYMDFVLCISFARIIPMFLLFLPSRISIALFYASQIEILLAIWFLVLVECFLGTAVIHLPACSQVTSLMFSAFLHYFSELVRAAYCFWMRNFMLCLVPSHILIISAEISGHGTMGGPMMPTEINSDGKLVISVLVAVDRIKRHFPFCVARHLEISKRVYLHYLVYGSCIMTLPFSQLPPFLSSASADVL